MIDSSKKHALVNRLLSLPKESPWVEHKKNNVDPTTIGENLSAVANSAALHDQPSGYVVWGINDHDKSIVGTEFKPFITRIGNELLEPWLTRVLSPSMPISMYELVHQGKDIVIMEIGAASHTPIKFKDREYIRIDSYTKRLSDYPEIERALWTKCAKSDFEGTAALMDVSIEEVLSLINWAAFLAQKGIKETPNPEVIVEYLCQESFVVRRADHNRFDILNFGALLYGKDLAKFPLLGRKALRVVHYKGRNKVDSIGEQIFEGGYATTFSSALAFIMNSLPTNEQIIGGVRQDKSVYPELALRELLANALIHQDFNLRGTGPMVEIYADRVDISNPGRPLIDAMRLLDHPPRSRNERLASYMRRCGYCEERGAGIDRVFYLAEEHFLPSPDFQPKDESFTASLYGPANLTNLSKAERLIACYWHACLKYVEGDRLTNASLRKRLRMVRSNSASALIKEAVERGLIKQHDKLAGSRNRSYVPNWA